MFYHNRRFNPKLLPTLATLVMLPILLSLGFWQLDRMQEKQTLLDLLQQGAETPIVTFEDLGAKPARYTATEVRGELLGKFSILLEHQMHNQQVGYHVLTPLFIAADKPLLLVNRGWITKQEAVSLITPQAQIELKGLINYPSEDRFILGDNLSADPSGQLKIQRIVFSELETQLKQPLYPYVLLLDPTSPAGFIRDWEIKTLPPSKHLGYAVQWFALAITLVILYLFASWPKKSKK